MDDEEYVVYYDDFLTSFDDLEQQEELGGDDYVVQEDAGKEDATADFDVLQDIDTVLFMRVNSFYHSISNQQLDREPLGVDHHPDVEESVL